MFFKLNRPNKKYNIINLYKVVDVSSAELFPFKKYVKNLLSFIKDKVSDNYSHFEINYGMKTWKTEEGFLKGIKKMNDKECVHLLITGSHSKPAIVLENLMLNKIEQPEFSVIISQLSMPLSIGNNEILTSFANKQFDFLNFDYGYLIELDDSYDFLSERKIKKSLFGMEVAIKEIDIVWNTHNTGIVQGYLKKLYNVNFINQSHLQKPIFQNLQQENIGIFTPLNDTITIWTLENHELELANRRLQESGILIADEKSYKTFLKSEKAKHFYQK